ncbi:MAG: hypothetical protein K2Y14_06210 [Burkholderiales bacterium]|nr:hypothetical protein [Burkholderiales bacterium]MBY0245919.1 hypothetical protein [Sphingobacteriaceae bacterium]
MSIFISPIELSTLTGYTTNAIRQKRRKQLWISLNVSEKDGRAVKIKIEKFNLWCTSNAKQIKVSTEKIQFMKFTHFFNLYGVSETQLSRFCDAAKLQYNQLVIIAPDGKKLINTIYYQENLINLLTYLKIF